MTGSKCCLLKYKSKYTLYFKGLGDWKEIRISFYNSNCSYTHKVPNNNSMIIVNHSQYVCAIWAQNSLSNRCHERHMCLNPTTLKYVMHIGECVEVSALKGVPIRLHMTTVTYKYSIPFYQTYITAEWIQNSCNTFGLFFSFREMHYGGWKWYPVHNASGAIGATDRAYWVLQTCSVNQWLRSFI